MMLCCVLLRLLLLLLKGMQLSKGVRQDRAALLQPSNWEQLREVT